MIEPHPFNFTKFTLFNDYYIVNSSPKKIVVIFSLIINTL